MIGKGLGLLVVCTFLALVFFLSIAVSIVKRKEKLVRNVTLLFAFVSLCSIMFTVGYVVVKSVLKGKDILVDTSERLLGNEYYTSAMVDSLKLLEPLGVQVPPNYYTYFGWRDYYRFPIVYPYSIVGIDALDYASLQDESKLENILYSDIKPKIILDDIVEFSFDGYYLIATLHNIDDVFILFEFSTQRIERFETSEDLMKRAKELGFSARQKAITMYDYSRKF